MTPPVFEGGHNLPTPETREELVCDGCDATENVVEHPEFHDEVLCPKCARVRGLWHGAEDHARELVKAPLQAWFAHWQAAGIDAASLQDILEAALQKVIEDRRAALETGTPA